MVLVGIARVGWTQEISEWRPGNRTGISPETGLLKQWPEGGPELLWTYEGLAKGHSSVSFGQDKIFITGTEGHDDILYALDMQGKLLWSKVMGRAWDGSYPNSRATPTVQGNRVYTCSGLGDLACFDAGNGAVLWSYKGSEENKGTYGNWGIAESLLIDGEKIFFSPGGPEIMTLALNKNTGKVIWKSESLDDKPAYASPILRTYAGEKMLIHQSLDHVFGMDPETGAFLWKVPHMNNRGGRDMIKCVTPLFKDGMVYTTGGYDSEGMMVKIGPDGKSAEVVWRDQVLDVHHGGVVEIGGFIYGSNWLNNGDGNWCCIDWNTGEKRWEEHWNCKGSIIAAEGMLYIYDEKRGNVGLVRPTPEKFDLVSSFQITQGGMGPFWSHPVIRGGVLYIRHMDALMAYNIRR
ncbi:MAG: PQQ-binding-like beta-propeller repeat protein [Bacteroidales bacterium]